MKKPILITAILFSSFSLLAQSKDTTAPRPLISKDSVDVMPDKFKMDLQVDEVQVLVDEINKKIQALVDKREAILAQARKQIIKKPK